MPRILVLALAVVTLIFASLLLARQGLVKTKDGMVFEGDITDKGDSLDIAGVLGTNGVVTVSKANVQEVTYPDEIAAQVYENLKKLDPKDVASRLTMAQLAEANHAYQAAHDVLLEVLRIDPGNKAATEMLASVNGHIPAPATRPATTQAATPTTIPVAAPRIPPGAYIARRLLTPAEMNRIRQFEWQNDPSKPVVVRVDAETKRKFLEASPDVKRSDFNAMKPQDQAQMIFDSKFNDLRQGIEIKGDPGTLGEYKKSVNKIVVQSCATSSCHGGGKGGSLILYAGNNDQAIYTNFLILQRYAAEAKSIPQQPVVDRLKPDASLLLQYLLVPTIADTPHPQAAGFKGAIRNKSDPRYQQIFLWIKTLPPVMPAYGVNLNSTEDGK